MQVNEISSSFSNTSKMRYYYANIIIVVGVKCPIYLFYYYKSENLPIARFQIDLQILQ